MLLCGIAVAEPQETDGNDIKWLFVLCVFAGGRQPLVQGLPCIEELCSMRCTAFKLQA